MYDERFRNIEVKIGILVVAVFLATVLSLGYVAYKKDLFAKRITYRIISPTGEKLHKGMPVKFEGFHMGEVTNIDLNDNAQIVLTVKILNRYHKWIKTDSHAVLNQESIIGAPFLEFTKGSDAKPVLPPNTTVELQFKGGVDEIVQKAKPVMQDLKQTLQNVRVLTDDLSSPTGDLRRFLASLRKTGDTLTQGDGMVPYLIANRESKEKLEQILKKMSEMGDGYKKLADDLVRVANKLDVVADGLDRGVNKKLNPILDDMKRTTADLYLMRRDLEHTISLSNDLILKLNNTWPLTPGDKERKAPELPNP